MNLHSTGPRAKAAMVYAAAMLASGAYCVLQSLEALPLALGVAALSVLAAGALGYGLGAWYQPVDAERPTFELVAIPVLIALGAPTLGAGVFLLLGLSFSDAALGDSPLLAFPGAIAMTLRYLSVTWPVALCAFGVAGVALAREGRRALGT